MVIFLFVPLLFFATLVCVPASFSLGRALGGGDLRSFANYIYAYESTRSLFEYYLWTEDDYVAVAPLFDLELLHLYARTFGGQGGGGEGGPWTGGGQGGVGLLSALLQGQPHEPLQAFGEHQESAMFSSAATMKALFTDTDPGLRGEPPRAALKRIANQLVQEQ